MNSISTWNGNLPALEIMSLPLDHFGSFDSNVGGLNTPELQIADNDYALGRLVATVSKSSYWKDTAIFVLEDDAQDGPDHVDAHRSPAFVVSAYTKRNSVAHKFYTTISVLRTIEDLLGLNHLGMNDANAEAMSDLFVTHPDLSPYEPVLPGSLCQPPVDPALIPECQQASVLRTPAVRPLHDGAWWAHATSSFKFKGPDALDAAAFNHVLWKGVVGEGKPYPAIRTGEDNDKRGAGICAECDPIERGTKTIAGK